MDLEEVKTQVINGVEETVNETEESVEKLLRDYTTLAVKTQEEAVEEGTTSPLMASAQSSPVPSPTATPKATESSPVFETPLSPKVEGLEVPETTEEEVVAPASPKVAEVPASPKSVSAPASPKADAPLEEAEVIVSKEVEVETPAIVEEAAAAVEEIAMEAPVETTTPVTEAVEEVVAPITQEVEKAVEKVEEVVAPVTEEVKEVVVKVEEVAENAIEEKVEAPSTPKNVVETAAATAAVATAGIAAAAAALNSSDKKEAPATPKADVPPSPAPSTGRMSAGRKVAPKDAVALDMTEDEEQGYSVSDASVTLSKKAPSGYVDEAPLDQSCCGKIARCFRTTYDVLRSIPYLTLIWAIGAIVCVNLAKARTLKSANKINFYGDAFDQYLTYLDWGVMFVDFVDAVIVLLAVLFTGATLEIFVKKTYKSGSCLACLKRYTVQGIQMLFFPATYAGFLAVTAVAVLAVIVAGGLLATEISCASIDGGIDSATVGAYLLAQVQTMVSFLHINKVVTIDTIGLEEFCAPDLHTAPSVGSWQMTFIYAAVAVLFQVNLLINAWSMYLRTKHSLSKGALKKKHSTTLEKINNQLAAEKEKMAVLAEEVEEDEEMKM